LTNSANPYLTRFANVLNLLNAEKMGADGWSTDKELLHTMFPAIKALMQVKTTALPLLVAHPDATDRVAIMIEPRVDADLPSLIKHTMHMLNHPSHSPGGPTWAFHLFCSLENAAFLIAALNLTRAHCPFESAPGAERKPKHRDDTQTLCSGGALVRLTRLPKLNRDAYSGLTTSSSFHGMCTNGHEPNHPIVEVRYAFSPADALHPRHEHYLIFQNDVLMRKPSSLEAFLPFDFVGALWYFFILFGIDQLFVRVCVGVLVCAVFFARVI
jgi:hypothetical protein